ncbi:PAS domain-containing protein [Mycobacterium sp.]|uniref:PAS domain-containing protein n=1 Tax=Mycobacterium sp. TaxID=1785 RepID=UPI0031E0DF8A
MTHDWLLVETLGDEPAVVAMGRQQRNFLPIHAFLRRNPRLSALRTAIAETVQTGKSLVSITPKSARVIRAEPVVMSDGRIHGVHVWSGPAKAEPPERPIPGPLKWDFTLGVATDTPESLFNNGKNPEVENTDGRSFADNWPSRELKPHEAEVLALAVNPQPGQTLCAGWDTTDWQANPIRVSFVARNAVEPGQDGQDHMVGRGMNWRAEPAEPPPPADRLAQQILQGLAQPGVHRALFDLKRWTLLKWLDEPCPFYDWRPRAANMPRVHPDDAPTIAALAAGVAEGATTAVLRMPGAGGDWVPVHVTVNRVELGENTFAGLVSLRLPTAYDLADAGLARPAESSSR